MSILPSLNHGSTSSSSSSTSQSSSSNHGFINRQQNLQFSASPPPPSHLSGGQMSPSARNQGGSTEEVKVRERQNHGKSPVQQHDCTNSPPKGAAYLQVGSSEQPSKPSGTVVSSSVNQIAASSTSQMSSGHSTGKKAQAVNYNHLLNFHYDPITVSRPQYRAPPPRRQSRRKPYNKDLFFQANYKFVVLDTGNYATESIDPDKMLCWEDIICLKYSTPFPAQCPICLDDPLCPQITSCGHIYCFPCILQYFSMGEDDPKVECWRKCPLCFTMISTKELYTIRIENVKQCREGDEIDFVLLTRKKDSFSSSVKDNENIDIEDEIVDSFSKFTLTSDVALSVREAMSDLDSWIAKADSGLVDDIEKLPYVCAAMEQLKRRKKYWNEHCTSNFDRAKYGSPPTADAHVNNGASGFATRVISPTNDKSDRFGKSSPSKVLDEFHAPEVTDINESVGDKDIALSSSFDENKMYPQAPSNGTKKSTESDSYNFYQAIDGQHLILHPFSMKCLLHHYGSYENLPTRISGKILQLETVTQSEAMRRRYRFLSHFSLTTSFQLCEIDVGKILPSESLSPFMDEIKNRENQRKRLARKELKDKIKAEAASSQFAPVSYYSHDAAPSFSTDDFEALGSPPVISSSGPSTAGERLTFSSVARLGFAAAHDSPVQITPKIDPSHDSAAIGWKNSGASFANVTSRAKHDEASRMANANANANEVGKKGKKASRVLLSTSGGRRY
ncbi:RING finger protein 10 isoform X1 [Salvia splendens]|uniref:RING finger protein 10 isoform X1 n=1 Tax=Salvia splendens TaxID=180675 RepID=UPI001C25E86F|nr:RING finger protein 10 isoform X1 [Salvia splendens]